MHLHVESISSYKSSSIDLLKQHLVKFYGKDRFKTLTIEDIKKDINALNAYPNIESMKEVDHNDIFTIDENIATERAITAILEGKVLWEHAVAGEGIRLGVGTKYVVNPKDIDFNTIRDMLVIEAINDKKPKDYIEKIISIPDEQLKKEISCNITEILPISLGLRHMLQLVYDLRLLAKLSNKDIKEVIERQKLIINMNEHTSDIIASELESFNFLGFKKENILFMEQKSFHGMTLKEGNLAYYERDKNGNEVNNKRLHNHGQMAMQKLHDRMIYHFSENSRSYISRNEFFTFLESCEDMISYNIEDISYLTSSIDLQSLATALMLKDKGFSMVMEVVGQNPIRPQKGASLFYDPGQKKNVMIETFRMSNITPNQIKLMNKNFNHYPNPLESHKALLEQGLPLGFEIKKGPDGNEYIYLCTVQGDINFIVNTAFVTRKDIKPINAWKSASQTTLALKAMHDQDQLPGFKGLAKELKLI